MYGSKVYVITCYFWCASEQFFQMIFFIQCHFQLLSGTICKKLYWLLCEAKNFDWSRKITPLSNLTRASLLVEWKLTAKAKLIGEIYKSWRKCWKNRDTVLGAMMACLNNRSRIATFVEEMASDFKEKSESIRVTSLYTVIPNDKGVLALKHFFLFTHS